MAHSTRFPGSNEPLYIFQDDMFEPARPMTSHAPMPSVTRPSRRPLGSTNSNVVLNPPSSQGSSYSPNKGKSSSPRSPLMVSGAKLNMVSMAPPVFKQKTTDSLMKKPQLSNFKTSAYGKENMHPMLFPNAPATNLSVDRYYQKDNGKRALMDAAPIRDARAPKKIKAAPEPPALPAHDSFPATVDDGTKPAHSYAQLIGMAILRSPLRRLTLAQIYKWISDNYSFYNPNDAGWQNSIRHNLSLHKNFIKIERPKDDPGKGNYWGIEPGTEQQFLKEKPPRKSAPSAENIPVMSTRLEPSRPAPSLMSEPTLPPHIHMHHSSFLPLPTSKANRSTAAEISSDATIPISDGLAPEEGADRHEPELPGDNLFSPVHSSPPVARRDQDGTPPSMSRNASSAIRSQKRRFASMDDSGYMSSFESSVMRPNQKAMLLTSEADRPRIKRGRAEEEIARLRNSSPFSPTKSRSLAYGPISSSPLRQINENQMLPPLTPVVKMKTSVRPPPSISPNTNLRLHRDKVRHMLQSPLRRVTGVEDNMPWSPAFQLDETIYAFDDLDTNVAEFDIFQDLAGLDEASFPVIGSVASGSPVKRVNKRARLDRSMSTSALNEMTNSGKSITSAPLLRVPEHSPMKFLGTPSKVFEGMSSPSRLFRASPCRNSPSKFSAAMLDMPAESEWPTLMGADDFLGTGADASEFSGLDIMQGFQKIGAGKSKGSKPGLERSYTSTF